jgi:tetratricopeptide (TPR) repeat protein
MVADTLTEEGEYARASTLAQEALQALQKHLPADHPRLAEARWHLGRVLGFQKHYDEALVHLRAAREVYIQRRGVDHPFVAWQLTDEAIVLRGQGKHAEALALTRKALATFEKSVDPDDWRLVDPETLLGHLLRDARNYGAALTHYQRALDIGERRLGRTNLRISYPRPAWARRSLPSVTRPRPFPFSSAR